MGTCKPIISADPYEIHSIYSDADGLLDMLDGDEEFIDEDWFREIEPKKE